MLVQEQAAGLRRQRLLIGGCTSIKPSTLCMLYMCATVTGLYRNDAAAEGQVLIMRGSAGEMLRMTSCMRHIKKVAIRVAAPPQTAPRIAAYVRYCARAIIAGIAASCSALV
jgi:hypothetical protein